jgi:hypothetical protein
MQMIRSLSVKEINLASKDKEFEISKGNPQDEEIKL